MENPREVLAASHGHIITGATKSLEGKNLVPTEWSSARETGQKSESYLNDESDWTVATTTLAWLAILGERSKRWAC